MPSIRPLLLWLITAVLVVGPSGCSLTDALHQFAIDDEPRGFELAHSVLAIQTGPTSYYVELEYPRGPVRRLRWEAGVAAPPTPRQPWVRTAPCTWALWEPEGPRPDGRPVRVAMRTDPVPRDGLWWVGGTLTLRLEGNSRGRIDTSFPQPPTPRGLRALAGTLIPLAVVLDVATFPVQFVLWLNDPKHF